MDIVEGRLIASEAARAFSGYEVPRRQDASVEQRLHRDVERRMRWPRSARRSADASGTELRPAPGPHGRADASCARESPVVSHADRGVVGVTRGNLDPLLLTPEEVAEILRVSRSTIYDLMRSARLRSVKIGGSRRVPVAAVTQFVESLCGEDVA